MNHLTKTCSFLTTSYGLFTGATAGHAQELGFRTAFLEDCSRGIDPNDIKDTLERVKANHGVVINSGEVRKLAFQKQENLA